jgi:hypothetical protein
MMGYHTNRLDEIQTMEQKMNTVKELSLAYVAPRPLVTPAWTAGDDRTFISADFTIDGYNVVHIVATVTRGHIVETFQTIDCDLEDAVDFATDLVSDARGTLYNDGVSVFEMGDLVKAVRDLVSKVEARQVA